MHADFQRTVAHATAVREALHKAMAPFIDALDENEHDAKSAPKVLGLVIGARAFIGEFTGLEAHVVEGLERSGLLAAERYASMVRMSAVIGKADADLVAEALGRDER